MATEWNDLYENGREYRITNELLLNLILERGGQKPAANVLDVGCGTGDLSVKLARHGLTVTGIDLAVAAIEKAKQRSAEAGTETITDFSVLDIKNPEQAKRLDGQKYDLIFCKLVYAFISDKPAFLTWVKDHLADGGAFILITPVLHEGVEYSKRLNSISVPLVELKGQLGEAFESVEDIHTDYFEEWGDERTIIAR